MSLYLSLDQTRFSRYDYGMKLTGQVWENPTKTIPHDLREYDEIRYRYFRRDSDLNFVNSIVTVLDEAPYNTWEYITKVHTFLNDDMFQVNLALKKSGANLSTVPEEILVEQSGGKS